MSTPPDAIAGGRPGRQWSLDLADRVLLVAAYWRTNLTMRQIGPLFSVSHSAAHRVIDTLGPLLARDSPRYSAGSGRPPSPCHGKTHVNACRLLCVGLSAGDTTPQRFSAAQIAPPAVPTALG